MSANSDVSHYECAAPQSAFQNHPIMSPSDSASHSINSHKMIMLKRRNDIFSISVSCSFDNSHRRVLGDISPIAAAN